MRAGFANSGHRPQLADLGEHRSRQLSRFAAWWMLGWVSQLLSRTRGKLFSGLQSRFLAKVALSSLWTPPICRVSSGLCYFCSKLPSGSLWSPGSWERLQNSVLWPGFSLPAFSMPRSQGASRGKALSRSGLKIPEIVTEMISTQFKGEGSTKGIGPCGCWLA